MPSIYHCVKTELADVTTETDNIKTFLLRPEVPVSFNAGQFVEVTLPGLGEAPFTPSSSPAEDQELAVTVMKAGKVTSAMHELEPGAELGVRGPYGNIYPLDDYEGRNILILGGGVGLAPLRSLLYALLADRDRFERIVLCYGARTPDDLVYKDQLPEWSAREDLEVHLTVDKADEDWDGKEGVVTETLEDVTIDTSATVGVVCGPPIMMRFGTIALENKGFTPENIYLSMERNMSCGLGKCGHCRIGNYYVCKDGPVFTYQQLEGTRHLW
ncbi:MAG: FAD/NAD(P)-binding protein [Candidatus Brocadiia bacterium]